MHPVSDIIAQVESGARLEAVRFEPAKWAHYLTVPSAAEVAICAHWNECSQDTARAICATSYGRFQMMAANLYAPASLGGFGYEKPILRFWADTDGDQLAAFDWFLKARRIDDITAAALESDAPSRLRFATVYNGPGAPAAYAQSILSAIKTLSA